MENMKELVKSFYTKCLTVNNDTNLPEYTNQLLDDNFLSINAKETKSKQILIGQLQYFWKLIPDLKWAPKEIIQEGNQVVVRSEFSGSPIGEFMGLNLNGSKSFKTMSIDIHTVENGKIVKIYHIEEWSTAIEQLK